MKKIKEVLQLKYITDLNIRQISRAIKVPKSTVGDSCKRFEKTEYTIDKFLAFYEDEIYQHLFHENL